jgi:putative membrane protein
MTRLTLAWLHLLALGFGLGAIIDRGAALREPISPATMRRAFRDDTAWGIAAIVWIASGLWRLLAGTEKATTYYVHNRFFQAKMALLILILVLEISPMITLIRWRVAVGRGGEPTRVVPPTTARRVATISAIQAVLVVLMVLAAVAMARGYGAQG